ncbi:MAG TPA: efflux RND transporter permease subunit [Chthonomonadaceae bacterium]|nr:efflux RND transporter permease subunit [Chthonomonadaceae bacterium]
MSIELMALRRPYTFVVMALLILILGVVTVQSTPTDVFPTIDIPVASVIWAYNGASPDDMEKRIVTIAERSYTTAVNDIQHIESQSMPGVSVIKVFFQPGAKVEGAVAQLTATSQTLLKILPPGITPPLIIQYSASSVPIVQIGISSKTRSEQEIYDYAQNFVRVQLATVQGASTPSPYGGKPRQIMIDLDPQALQAKGLSAYDVSAAINAQNLMLPSGTAKMGTREYTISLNSSPEAVATLNSLPIRRVNGAMVYVRDVAQVHDGYAVQTNIVNRDGKRACLLTILKGGNASTLSVVERVKALLPKIKATLPADIDLQLMADQSLFVRASVNGVVREAVIAAILTAIMILLFLGSWRSTLIVATSIPLSILCSIIVLGATGQTLNVMTLGGLALAVGILVDNAIVVIENIYRNLGLGKTLRTAILEGAEQIAAPSLVATLAICIVFVPILFLGGAAGSLFKPLAMAVVYAMIASYLLSRTFVTVAVRYLLKREVKVRQYGRASASSAQTAADKDMIWRIHLHFDRFFRRLYESYRRGLIWSLRHRAVTLIGFLLFFAGSLALLPSIGQDFFPTIDAGSFRLHVRAPAGTRIEETERAFAQVETQIRKTIPVNQLDLILDNIGLPVGGVNFAYSTTGAIGPSDGEILVTLKEGHAPTQDFIQTLRTQLPQRFPQLTFFFQPADITTQILNFGLPAPIDIQVTGRSQENYALTQQIAARVRRVAGAADVHIHQVVDMPEIRVNVDRERAQEFGLTQKDIASNLLISLSSSGQAFPNYWLDPKNGVSYLVAVQTPQYKLDSLQQLENTPIVTGSRSSIQALSNLSTVRRKENVAVVNHYNVQPTYDIYANVQSRDLGGVSRDIDRVLQTYQTHLPRGTSVVVRGQVESMKTSFLGLGAGLIFSVLLVYLLLVVNYQSWIDPLIILSVLPGVLSGIALMLFTCFTTFSVPALMGAIMCVGVGTANSVLLITFANDRRQEGEDAVTAALTAGCSRLRPSLMTAAAIILGMLPMALALGEGGEQNAPLGRAVIGGLIVATITTLYFVPVVYSILRRKQPHPMEGEEPTLPAHHDMAAPSTLSPL